MKTTFQEVYNNFLSKLTDDMYMELTMQDTYDMLQDLLVVAIHMFEFPRHNLNTYDIETQCFADELTQEEINILGTYMVVEWIGQQLVHIDNVRMKFSGSDFKFSSQANHMQKLSALQKEYERKGFHLQRLYCRRKIDENGVTRSTFGKIITPI